MSLAVRSGFMSRKSRSKATKKISRAAAGNKSAEETAKNKAGGKIQCEQEEQILCEARQLEKSEN
jgi:hypothetical protein